MWSDERYVNWCKSIWEIWHEFCLNVQCDLKEKTLFTQSHYFSYMCTKEAKSRECNNPINFQIYQGNFHLFCGESFRGIFIFLQTSPWKKFFMCWDCTLSYLITCLFLIPPWKTVIVKPLIRSTQSGLKSSVFMWG